jgi:membrane-associated phospholipid phosphatase
MSSPVAGGLGLYPRIGVGPWFGDLQRSGFLQVNRWAVETPFLHGALRGFAQYGEVVFALLLLLNLLHAYRTTTRAARRGAGSSAPLPQAPALSAAVWAPVGMLLAIAVNQPLVHAFHEPRPYTAIPNALVLVARSADYSLPSDHAVMAGAVAAGVLLTQRQVSHERRRPLLSVVTVAAALLMAFAGACATTLLYLVSRPLIQRVLERALALSPSSSRTESRPW